jgi:hypothetical protein
LSFCTDFSHQTHLSAPIVNNIPHANLKRRSRLTEASHDFVSPPHFHRAKNVFHATTNLFTIVFFLLVGQRRISITFFANSRNVTAFPQRRNKRAVSRIRLRKILRRTRLPLFLFASRGEKIQKFIVIVNRSVRDAIVADKFITTVRVHVILITKIPRIIFFRPTGVNVFAGFFVKDSGIPPLLI